MCIQSWGIFPPCITCLMSYVAQRKFHSMSSGTRGSTTHHSTLSCSSKHETNNNLYSIRVWKLLVRLQKSVSSFSSQDNFTQDRDHSGYAEAFTFWETCRWKLARNTLTRQQYHDGYPYSIARPPALLRQPLSSSNRSIGRSCPYSDLDLYYYPAITSWWLYIDSILKGNSDAVLVPYLTLNL